MHITQSVEADEIIHSGIGSVLYYNSGPTHLLNSVSSEEEEGDIHIWDCLRGMLPATVSLLRSTTTLLFYCDGGGRNNKTSEARAAE